MQQEMMMFSIPSRRKGAPGKVIQVPKAKHVPAPKRKETVSVAVTESFDAAPGDDTPTLPRAPGRTLPSDVQSGVFLFLEKSMQRHLRITHRSWYDTFFRFEPAETPSTWQDAKQGYNMMSDKILILRRRGRTSEEDVERAKKCEELCGHLGKRFQAMADAYEDLTKTEGINAERQTQRMLDEERELDEEFESAMHGPMSKEFDALKLKKKKPSAAAMKVIMCGFTITGHWTLAQLEESLQATDDAIWKVVKPELHKLVSSARQFDQGDAEFLDGRLAAVIEQCFVGDPNMHPNCLMTASPPVASLSQWILDMLSCFNMSRKFLQLELRAQDLEDTYRELRKTGQQYSAFHSS